MKGSRATEARRPEQGRRVPELWGWCFALLRAAGVRGGTPEPRRRLRHPVSAPRGGTRRQLASCDCVSAWGACSVRREATLGGTAEAGLGTVWPVRCEGGVGREGEADAGAGDAAAGLVDEGVCPRTSAAFTGTSLRVRGHVTVSPTSSSVTEIGRLQHAQRTYPDMGGLLWEHIQRHRIPLGRSNCHSSRRRLGESAAMTRG